MEVKMPHYQLSIVHERLTGHVELITNPLQL